MPKNDGGAAFPFQSKAGKIQNGMSLRDWLAGKTNPELYKPFPSNLTVEQTADLIARIRYTEADAMLAEKEAFDARSD